MDLGVEHTQDWKVLYCPTLKKQEEVQQGSLVFLENCHQPGKDMAQLEFILLFI